MDDLQVAAIIRTVLFAVCVFTIGFLSGWFLGYSKRTLR